MMESPVIMRILAASVSSGNLACKIIREILTKGNLSIVDKGVNDFQTLADRNSQRSIIKSLNATFPTLKIIGEEGVLDDQDIETCSTLDSTVLSMKCPEKYKDVSIKDTVVWVDPIDGTNEFTQVNNYQLIFKGLVHHVTVLIGLAVKGKAVGGVICQPFYRETGLEDVTKIKIGPDGMEKIQETSVRTIWGLDELGVHGDIFERPPLPDPKFDKSGSNIIVTTRSHPTQISNKATEACSPSQLARIGGCGFKVLSLLDGNAHAYLFASAGCKKWDTCAPEAIIRAANGELTDITGNHYDYSENVEFMNSTGVLATANKTWHIQYLERIPNSVKTVLLNSNPSRN